MHGVRGFSASAENDDAKSIVISSDPPWADERGISLRRVRLAQKIYHRKFQGRPESFFSNKQQPPHPSSDFFNRELPRGNDATN
ncbi:MAG: hypothetical protein DMG31_10785 [Acidobacteria bacterium]|nr:MAG: hypothetical protein DMG31_10785 [Acidobacteriota bacterium]